MSDWVPYRLAGSDVYIIVFARSNDVRSLTGGSIFVLGECKATGLAECTTDSEVIGDGLYWTYEESGGRVGLALNTPVDTVIGVIYIFKLEGGGVDISYRDAHGDEAIETISGSVRLRDRLNELTAALTGATV